MVFGIYCRKSVLSDKGESVENQLEMCRQYIYGKYGCDNDIKIYADAAVIIGLKRSPTKRALFRPVFRLSGILRSSSRNCC